MNINNRKQSQFELFPGSAENPYDKSKAHSLLKDLTVSPENIIVLCIIFTMILVLFFSLGVERGKRIVVDTTQEELAPFQIKTLGEETLNKTDQQEVAVEIDAKKTEIEAVPKEESAPVETQIPLDAYTIQVASFKLEVNAQKEAGKLKDIGYDIFIMPKGSHSIVCVGKFKERQEAYQFSKRLKSRYQDCLVRRL